MKEIYLFSGLGADERVFQNLDFSGFSATFIKWLTPIDNELIENYASRIANQIKTVKPSLIGLSFGGLIAIEVAKLIETENVIIIASAKSKNEIPFYYRWAGKVRLHWLLPTKLLKSSNFITNWFFGTGSEFDRQILKQVLFETDAVFLKWAIDKIVRWGNMTTLENIFHIHGTKDKILPISFVNCDLKIKNGGHLMTLNKPDELNEILRKQL